MNYRSLSLAQIEALLLKAFARISELEAEVAELKSGKAADSQTDLPESPRYAELTESDLDAARMRIIEQGWRCFVVPQGANASGEDAFKVKSQSGNVYAVFLTSTHGRCTCPDFTSRKRVCKHICGVIYYTFSYAEVA